MPSISLWTISLGLNRHSRDFGVEHYSTSILPAWLTTLSSFRDAAAVPGEDLDRITPYGFVAYDQIDSGLNTEAPYLAALVGADRVRELGRSCR